MAVHGREPAAKFGSRSCRERRGKASRIVFFVTLGVATISRITVQARAAKQLSESRVGVRAAAATL